MKHGPLPDDVVDSGNNQRPPVRQNVKFSAQATALTFMRQRELSFVVKKSYVKNVKKCRTIWIWKFLNPHLKR